MTRRRFAALAALLGAISCFDPVTPRSGTATLDDPITGSVAAISVGRDHACALTTAGDAYCWGSNEFSQVGATTGTMCPRDDRLIPCEPFAIPVGGAIKFQRIAAGGSHTCGLALDGKAYCWGDNRRGQLGDPSLAVAESPMPVQTAQVFAEIAAGDEHTCAIRTDGVVYCWGANDWGQLGIPTGTGTFVPVTVSTNLRFAAISAGGKRTCARQADGTPYCWGSHWVVRAVDGTEVTRSQSAPARVQSAPAYRQMSVGLQSTCALEMDGTAACWEANYFGQMGDGTRAGSTSPRHLWTDVQFTSISVGGSSSCGVAVGGAVYCWGDDTDGQLGVSVREVHSRCGVTPCSLSPNKTSGWRSFASVAVGLGSVACGLTSTASVYCWGAGSLGQRGDGVPSTSQWSSVRVDVP